MCNCVVFPSCLAVHVSVFLQTKFVSNGLRYFRGVNVTPHSNSSSVHLSVKTIKVKLCLYTHTAVIAVRLLFKTVKNYR